MSRTTATSSSSEFVPLDLVATTLLGCWVLMPSLAGTGNPVRVILGLATVFFVPGYAFVAALFPKHGLADDTSSTVWFGRNWARRTDSSAPTLLERVVLSVGLSVCLVPILGIGLDFTAWGITRETMLSSVGTVTILSSAIAALRRWQVPPSNRFTLSSSLGVVRDIEWFDDTTRGSLVNIHVLLAASLVLATAGLGIAVWHPTTDQSEQFTEFSLQTIDPETGDLVAGGFTDNRSIEATPVVVDVTNHEGERTQYTLVSKVQTISSDENQRVIVAEATLNRTSFSVPPDETKRFRDDIDPERAGKDNRLTYLLYVGEPPENPTVENAYRSVHLWLKTG